jgi:hypothetical protein
MAKKDSGLASRFDRVSEDISYRSIVRLCGERGTGKTHFACTAPGPILLQSLDHGTEGMIEKFVKEGKEIYLKEYAWHPGAQRDKEGDVDFDQDYAKELRQTIEDDYRYALEHGVRTVIRDKETDIWELYRYAEFGGPSEAPKDYPALNQRYMAEINLVKAYPGVNLFLIQGMKDEWGTKKRQTANGVKESPAPTGVRVPSGFSRLDELVFVEIMCRRQGAKFYLDLRWDHDPSFGKCRQNPELSGDSFEAVTFPQFGTLLMPETEESDWE